jgi:hypothetical protein
VPLVLLSATQGYDTTITTLNSYGRGLTLKPLQFCLQWLLIVLCSGMSHMNSGRNFSAFRKGLIPHFEVKTANIFLLVDLKFETIFKISIKVNSDNIQVPQFLNGSFVPKVYVLLFDLIQALSYFPSCTENVGEDRQACITLL